MKSTVFAHFCAGEKQDEVVAKVQGLQSHGVGGILDYAAEAKPDEVAGDDTFAAQVVLFKDAVSAAAAAGSGTYVAVKPSALADVPTLTKASSLLVAWHRLFYKLAGLEGREDAYGMTEGNPVLSKEQFCTAWRDNVNPEAEQAWSVLGVESEADLAAVRGVSVRALRTLGAGLPTMTDADCDRLDEGLSRLHEVCAAARSVGVRVLVDAEWAHAQPAYDRLVLDLMRTHNVGLAPTVFQTYQCYLRGARERCAADVALADREGWGHAAKLVRGAYMVSERESAARDGRASPIWDDFDQTSACYEATADLCLEALRPGRQVLIASHNQDSVLHVAKRMRELGIEQGPVMFAQLLGMADNVTYSLAGMGYHSFKYLPYGPINEVVPYLIRRTQENSTLLGSDGVRQERRLIFDETVRRVVAGEKLQPA